MIPSLVNSSRASRGERRGRSQERRGVERGFYTILKTQKRPPRRCAGDRGEALGKLKLGGAGEKEDQKRGKGGKFGSLLDPKWTQRTRCRSEFFPTAKAEEERDEPRGVGVGGGRKCA